MSISNLNNVHLTEEQVRSITETLAQLETALQPLQVNLTADDRNRYGRVNEQNKLFIHKVNDFLQTQPSLKSPDVDWEEFSKDFKSRTFYENAINRLESLVVKLKNSKTLHDYDNYQDALNDYAYANYKAGTKTAGFEAKQKELKQFFAKTRKKEAKEEVTADNPQ